MAFSRRQTQVNVYDDKAAAGVAAAETAAELIREAISKRGNAYVTLATGMSQFEMFATLVKANVDWGMVTAFHLDEYVGLADSHPASFRKYLKERFCNHVSLKEMNYLDGDCDDPYELCRKMGKRILRNTVDVTLLGIGENGHLAFNDPPADFETTVPFGVVELDTDCRMQQVGEGWFATLDNVPARAISMPIREILRARTLLCVCPDERKAEAVRRTLEGPIGPETPASILRVHPDCRIFLDRPSSLGLDFILHYG